MLLVHGHGLFIGIGIDTGHGLFISGCVSSDRRNDTDKILLGSAHEEQASGHVGRWCRMRKDCVSQRKVAKVTNCTLYIPVLLNICICKPQL